jgi:CRISPR-associated protein Csx3
LTQVLRERNIPHYLLRAAPDGEGDWSNEVPPHLLHDIRFKGSWSSHWVSVTCRDIAARTLPLLIDMGGKPTLEQGAIFDQCTDAILLTPNAEMRKHWRAMVQSHSLPILADLHSALPNHQIVADYKTYGLSEVSGTLVGLERGTRASGPVFDALVARLSTLFAIHADELRRAHLAFAPQDAVVLDFGSLAEQLYPDDPAHRFQPQDIEQILERVPHNPPIALYGRIPVWLAARLGARRQVRWQFDARLGWIQPPKFVMAEANAAHNLVHLDGGNDRGDDGGIDRGDDGRDIEIQCVDHGESARINLRLLGNGYLDLRVMDGLRVPHVSSNRHVVLSGKLPLWFFVALGRVYAHCRSVLAEQPQLKA